MLYCTDTEVLNCEQQSNVLYRGTTPIFNFNVCVDTTLIDLENTHIIFASGEGIVDKSGVGNIVLGDGTMGVSLSKADTLSFTGTQVNIQILVTMQNGQKPVSDIMVLPVADSLRGDTGW